MYVLNYYEDTLPSNVMHAFDGIFQSSKSVVTKFPRITFR